MSFISDQVQFLQYMQLPDYNFSFIAREESSDLQIIILLGRTSVRSRQKLVGSWTFISFSRTMEKVKCFISF